MKFKLNKIVNTFLCLLIALLLLECNNSRSYDCNKIKIQMLLEDVFRKKTYFPVFVGNIPSKDNSDKNRKQPDSSMYFNYLYSSNLKIPDIEFYLYWDNSLEPSYPDSVKLRVVDEPSLKNKYSHKVGITLLEVNEDTTKLKLNLSYGTDVLIAEGTFTYSFNENNCKWSVLDSTIWRY